MRYRKLYTKMCDYISPPSQSFMLSSLLGNLSYLVRPYLWCWNKRCMEHQCSGSAQRVTGRIIPAPHPSGSLRSGESLLLGPVNSSLALLKHSLLVQIAVIQALGFAASRSMVGSTCGDTLLGSAALLVIPALCIFVTLHQMSH